MSESARVTSIEAMKDFQAALAKFCEDAADALIAVQMESRRALDWLVHDRTNYWTRAVRERQEKQVQAKNDLNRARLARVADREPDCIEQKKALRLAQDRLAEAEDKVEKLRRWIRVVQHALGEYEGQARQLADMVEGDPPRIIALVDRMIAALDSYVLLEPPRVAGPATVSSQATAPVDVATADSPPTSSSGAATVVAKAAPQASTSALVEDQR